MGNNQCNLPPFYNGEVVVSVAPKGSAFIAGKEYTVSTCEYKYCENGNSFYWYVGIVGSHGGGCYFTPKIFVSKRSQFIAISTQKVIEKENSLISAN